MMRFVPNMWRPIRIWVKLLFGLLCCRLVFFFAVEFGTVQRATSIISHFSATFLCFRSRLHCSSNPSICTEMCAAMWREVKLNRLNNEIFYFFSSFFAAQIECNGQSVMHCDSARNSTIIALDNDSRFWHRVCNTRLSMFTGHWIFKRTSRWHRIRSLATNTTCRIG